MAKINLRDLYPNDYNFDCFITVPDAIADTFILNMTKEIADVYVDAYREEAAYIRRRTRNKAYYSTESEEWLQRERMKPNEAPPDGEKAQLIKKRLHEAIDMLPDKQAKRIYDHFVLGLSKTEIARSEGVNESKVRKAIERGLVNLKKYLKDFSD
jgi:RNA polymerase sigma-70 factor (ECF subfamily)